MIITAGQIVWTHECEKALSEQDGARKNLKLLKKKWISYLNKLTTVTRSKLNKIERNKVRAEWSASESLGAPPSGSPPPGGPAMAGAAARVPTGARPGTPTACFPAPTVPPASVILLRPPPPATTNQNINLSTVLHLCDSVCLV
jgi:hypothetical protein